ncbi:hypothetical protein [Brevundimonas sp. FT23028]|uniref:hypothetical protein n=1 Tax=Brevundimonas sp. FT23028 TaxID=3393748 RepID=UPI003B58A50B
MRLMMVGALALAVAGCSDPVKDAQRELEIIENTKGSSAQLCAAREKLATAYLKTHDEKAYEEARLRASIQCMNAELERRYGVAPADPTSGSEAPSPPTDE